MIPRPPRPTLFPYTTLFRSISLLGGSRVAIAGPTGAFMPILYLIVQKHGYDGLAIATVMAGVILLILGIAKLGSMIKFIPRSEEHTSELQSQSNLVCRLLLEKKKKKQKH